MSDSIAPNDLQSIKDALRKKRYRASDIPATSGSGVYALYLSDPHALSDIPSGLLYIGMTYSSLEVRNHFIHADSSFSSPRRTLGAILKSKLGLHAIPRGSGRSAKDFTNYKFAAPGEDRLTAWMGEHLTYGFAVLENRVKEVEQELIACLQPAINLTDWPNPKRKPLKELRKVCRDEALQAASPPGVL
jgi:hypothetical protein